jgi:hypothetical protein
MEVALHVRRLPSIRITAPNKMRFAVTGEISYEGGRPQTIYFSHRDEVLLSNNIVAARKLVGPLGAPSVRSDDRLVWSDVPASAVLEFLEEYSFHPRSRDLNRELLSAYITKQNRVGGLQQWNVVVQRRARALPGLGELKLRDDVILPCISRSRMKPGDDQTAYIKALMSRIDILCDRADFDPKSLTDKKASELFRMRGDDPKGVIILYPVSKDSRPSNEGDPKCDRVRMNAKEHLLGLAFVFPRARGPFGASDYVRADLKPEESVVSSEPEAEASEETA